MTARAHVAIRLAAIVWIATLALLPRAGASASKPAADVPAQSAPAGTPKVQTRAIPAHGPALARR